MLKLARLIARVLPQRAQPVDSVTRTLGGVVRVTTSTTEYTDREVAAARAKLRAERLKAAAKKPKPQLPAGATMVRVDPDDVRERVGLCVLRASQMREERHAQAVLYYLALASGQPVYILLSGDYEWIDVLTSSKRDEYTGLGPDAFQRYGFSRDASRWSYGEGPYGAREIRAALRTLDPTIQSRERQ
jgi:hypothetical protein